MLADKYGITVTCKGADCSTNGKHINLPALPKHIDSPRLLGFVRAWLDHEVGHIVGDSDFKVGRAVGEKHGVPGHSLLNAVEDVRIEQVMADLWAGCEINLRVGMAEALKKLDKTSRDTTPASRDPDNPMTRADCVKHPLKQVTTALYCIGKGAPLPQWVDKDCAKIAYDANAQFNIAEVASWATCTADLVPMVEWVLDKYKQLRDERNRQGQQQPQPTSVTVKVGKGGGGQPMTDEQAKAINNANQVNVEYEDSDTTNPGGDAGDDAKKQGTDDSPAGPKQQPAQPEPGGTGSQPEQQTTGPLTDEQLAAQERLVDEMTGDVAKQIASAIQDELKQATKDHPEACQRPYEDGLDRLTPIQYQPSPSEVESFKRKAARAGGPMRQRLNQLLQSEDRVWWRGGRSRGVVDPKRVAMLASGITNDVLRTRHHHPSPNTACHLMIDGSGSMNGAKIEQAALAAAAFGFVLDVCGHKSAIAAFVGTTTNTELNYSERNRLSRIGIRSHGVQFAEIKRFGQPYRQCLPKLAALCHNSGGGTPLGESIIFAADQLRPRDEKRKVVLAFTDGSPNNSKYAKWACGYCEQRGIEVVLIGIRHAGVKHLHHRNAVCTNIESLGTTTMIELTKALRPES